MFVETHGKQKKEGLFGEMKAIKDFGEQGLFLIPPKGISWKKTFMQVRLPISYRLLSRPHWKNKLIYSRPNK